MDFSDGPKGVETGIDKLTILDIIVSLRNAHSQGSIRTLNF